MRYGSDLRRYDVRRFGIVVAVIVLFRLCKRMLKDLNGTLEHKESLEGGRQTVFREKLLGIGGFPVVLSILVLKYSKGTENIKTSSTFVLS
jgi:hypothetical protein